MTSLAKISALGVESSNRQVIVPGVKVRRCAFVLRDGPKHSGVVESIEWSTQRPPVIVVKMGDGKTERWGTKWTATGPWDAHAPFRTDQGNVVGRRA